MRTCSRRSAPAPRTNGLQTTARTDGAVRGSCVWCTMCRSMRRIGTRCGTRCCRRKRCPRKGRTAGQPRTWTRITDLPLTRAEASEAQACARSRWKIENETFNTLKNQGYQLEHNFGHGNEHLATVPMLLMMLAFLIDQLLETACPVIQQNLRQIP